MGEHHAHTESAFITLTYDQEHIWAPLGVPSVHPLHLRRFWARFRKLYPKIRYLACGEYGGESNRPHYHAIIFGWWPADAQSFGSHDGNPAFISDELSRLWLNQGTVLVEHVNLASISYVAGYVQKKLFGKLADEKYRGIFPPFVRQSQSLGRDYLKKYLPEILSGTISLPQSDGSARQVPVPRPWVTQLQRLHWVGLDNTETEHPYVTLKRARDEKRPPDLVTFEQVIAQRKHDASHELITLARRGQTQSPGDAL